MIYLNSDNVFHLQTEKTSYVLRALPTGQIESIYYGKKIRNQNKQNKEDKKCWYMQKALKPHFDILQKQILIWDDYADLTKKLEEWIRELSSR